MRKKKEYLSLQVGNDPDRYTKKEDLYEECLKYREKNVYKCELENAVKRALEIKENKVILVVRKLLCIW